MVDEHSADDAPGDDTAERGYRFPCSACGGMLRFSPSQSALKCPYCGTVQAIAASAGEVVERDYETYLAKAADAESRIAGIEFEASCAVCGGVTMLPAKTVTEECPYCGCTIHQEPEPAKKMLPPESLLPFRVESRAAVAAFREWVRGRWFVPSDFASFATEGRLLGLYVPFWTFDSVTISHYTGQRGEHYWVTETYQATNAKGEPETRTRQVMHTRWLPASGRVDHAFDDLLVPAADCLPKEYVRALEPWDLQALVPFDAAYLSGFRAERYQIDLKSGFEEARARMDQAIRQLCLADIGGDAQRLFDVRTQHLSVTFKHVLLPLWHSVYRYRDRPYHFVVNARTGEVQGERPVSWWKVSGAALAGGVLAGIVAVLARWLSQ